MTYLVKTLSCTPMSERLCTQRHDFAIQNTFSAAFESVPSQFSGWNLSESCHLVVVKVMVNNKKCSKSWMKDSQKWIVFHQLAKKRQSDVVQQYDFNKSKLSPNFVLLIGGFELPWQNHRQQSCINNYQMLMITFCHNCAPDFFACTCRTGRGMGQDIWFKCRRLTVSHFALVHAFYFTILPLSSASRVGGQLF